MSLTIEPTDVVRIAHALDVDPYGLTAGRLLEEAAARAAERSSGSLGSGTERRGSRAAREYAEEEAALGDAWLAHHGFPVEDGGRGFLSVGLPHDRTGSDAPYSPGEAGDEEELWRLHAASHGLLVDDRGQRSFTAGDEEERLWQAAAANLGLPEDERL